MIERKDCTCSCHSTGAVHFVPCCHEPIPDEIKAAIEKITIYEKMVLIGTDMATGLDTHGVCYWTVREDGTPEIIDIREVLR